MNSFGINARNWETKAGRDNMCYRPGRFYTCPQILLFPALLPLPAPRPHKYSSVYVGGNRICWQYTRGAPAEFIIRLRTEVRGHRAP